LLELDNLHRTKIPLKNISGALPALGFGRLFSRLGSNQKRDKGGAGSKILSAGRLGALPTEKEVGEAMQEVFKAGKIQRDDLFIETIGLLPKN
jgi:hypothetical protein